MSDNGSLIILVLLGAALLFGLAMVFQARPRATGVLVCGATGVGKSTLINALAGRTIADTGIGSPVTQNAVRLYVPERKFLFFDSRGLEVEEASQTYLLLLSDLLLLRYSRDTRAQIDLVLICIQDPQNRFDDAHHEIAYLCEDLRIPYGIAITKWEGDDKLAATIRENFHAARFVTPVRALELRTSRVAIPSFGLETLENALRSVEPWRWSAAMTRSRTALKTKQLSIAARQLAATQGSNQYAWVSFAAAALTLLEREKRPWPSLLKGMRDDLRAFYVPNFLLRNLLTKFDTDRIDGAIASSLVPFILRRFGDSSRQLTPEDCYDAKTRALASLEHDRPYRSRL